MREGWRWSTVPPGTRFCFWFCLSVSVSLYLFLSLCLYLFLSLPLSLILSLHLSVSVSLSLSPSLSLSRLCGGGQDVPASPPHKSGTREGPASDHVCPLIPAEWRRSPAHSSGWLFREQVVRPSTPQPRSVLGTRWGMNAVSLSAPVSAGECSGMPTAAFGGQPALQGPVTFSLGNSQTPSGLGALAVAVASWAPLGLGTGPSGRHWAGTGPPSLTLDLLSGEE